MSLIINYNIVQPEKEIWSLFLPSISLPVQESVHFLQTFVQSSSLPENFQPSLLQAGTDSEEKLMFPLRRQLLQWLIPNDTTTDNRKVTSLPDPNQLAHLLVLLIVKNNNQLSQQSTTKFIPKLTDAETVYIQTSHEFPFFSVEKAGDSITHCAPVLISVLLRNMEGLLKENLCRCMDIADVNTSHVITLAKEACCVARFMYWLLRYNIVTKDNINTTDAFLMLKAVLKKLSMFFCDVSPTQNPKQYVDALMWLQKLFNSDALDSSNVIVARICRSFVPDKLIELLLKIVFDKVTQSTNALELLIINTINV